MNVPQGEKLHSLLTDRHGSEREFSVPQGEVNDEYISQQRATAQSTLPGVFHELVIATIDPFIQTIVDLSVPKMAFERVCLLGDAAFVPRPHTASGASKAATNAITLANSINTHKGDVIEALKRWEPSQLEIGNYLVQLGISLGNRSQLNHP